MDLGLSLSGLLHSELLTPQGDQQLEQPVGQPVQPEQPAPSTQPVQPVVQPLVSTSTQQTTQPAVTVPVVTDTNSALQNQQPATTAPAPSEKPYTQADIDYAIASRYVELENEYLAKKKDIKNAAKEISYIVMDDFELTPSEWEAFLQRATVDNLFEKVRQQQAK